MKRVISLVSLAILALGVQAQPSIQQNQLKGKIVFRSDRGGSPDIWIMDANGNNAKQLTNNEHSNRDPRFSADGKKILFTSIQNGRRFIYLMNTDGSKSEKVTEGQSPDWAPDGRSFVYIDDGQTYVYDFASKKTKMLTPDLWERCGVPTVSPDGKFVAVASRHTAKIGIYILPLTGGEAVQLATGEPSCTPSWSRDGKTLLFQTTSGYVGSVQRNGNNRTRLTRGVGVQHDAKYSPDGSMLIYANAPTSDDDWQIHIQSIDGGEPLALTSTGSNAQPDWWASPQDSKPKAKPRKTVNLVGAPVTIWGGATDDAPVAAKLLNKEGFTQLNAAGQQAEGNLIIENEALIVHIGDRIRVFTKNEESPASLRAELDLLGANGAKAERLQTAEVQAVDRHQAKVRLSYAVAGGSNVTALMELESKEVWFDVIPESGLTGIHLDKEVAYAVIPDFFADDIVYDPQHLKPDQMRLMTDNYFVGMADEGDSMLIGVWKDVEQSLDVTLAGEADQRRFTSMEFLFNKPDDVFTLAVVAHKGVWKKFAIAPPPAKKLQNVPWEQAFAARWRINYMESNNAFSQMIARKRSKGTAAYNNGVLTLVRHTKTPAYGALLYPNARAGSLTPSHVYAFNDVFDKVFGMGPCEYVIQQNKNILKADRSGPAGGLYFGAGVCGTTSDIERMILEGASLKQREHINNSLEHCSHFIERVRNRLEGSFILHAREISAQYPRIAERGDAGEELVTELSKITDQMKAEWTSYEKRYSNNNLARQHADFVKINLKGDPFEDLSMVLPRTKIICDIAGMQDKMISRFRRHLRRLMNVSARADSSDPEIREFATEIRKRGRSILYGHPFPG